MPTSTSRSDQCSNRTEISVSARTRRSAHIRLDSRGASSPRCSYSRSTEREGAILLPSHQDDTADAEGSRCRKKLLCTTCSSCAFTFIIVLIHGCCHHTHFGSTSHTLSGNLQFCRWSTQFPSCMWRNRLGTLRENTQKHAAQTLYMV